MSNKRGCGVRDESASAVIIIAVYHEVASRNGAGKTFATKKSTHTIMHNARPGARFSDYRRTTLLRM